MVKGVGIDVVPLEEFKKRLDRTPGLLERLFTEREREEAYNVGSLAGRFALKEAFLKSIGKGLSDGIRWRDVEVLGGVDSPPRLVLHGRVKEICKGLTFLVSVSHAGGIAVAVCVAVSSNTYWPS